MIPDSPQPTAHELSDQPTAEPGCGKEHRLHTGRVIVAGYGPVGRAVVEYLEKIGIEVSIIDINLDTIERQLDLNKSITYGDVSDPAVLLKAGIRQARALILTIPDAQATMLACKAARHMAPYIFIAARVNYVSQGLLVFNAGADKVVVEEVVTAQAMRNAVCEHLLGDQQSP